VSSISSIKITLMGLLKKKAIRLPLDSTTDCLYAFSAMGPRMRPRTMAAGWYPWFFMKNPSKPKASMTQTS